MALFLSYLTCLIWIIAVAYNNRKITQVKIRSSQKIAGMIAHELRTPLTSMRFYAAGLRDLMQRGRMTSDNTLHIYRGDTVALQKIPDSLDREAYSALTTIDILLTNFRSSKQVASNFVPLDLGECLSKSLDRYPMPPQERAKITVDFENSCEIMGDPTLLQNIFFNLLKNALYALRQANKGTITIWFTNNHKHCCLHFKDTGTGISKKDQPQIFKPFFSRKRHGAGFGLAFCLEAMYHHKGTINLKSQAGKYTHFTLVLPRLNRVDS